MLWLSLHSAMSDFARCHATIAVLQGIYSACVYSACEPGQWSRVARPKYTPGVDCCVHLVYTSSMIQLRAYHLHDSVSTEHWFTIIFLKEGSHMFSMKAWQDDPSIFAIYACQSVILCEVLFEARWPK